MSVTENSSFAELANQRRASHIRTLLLCSIFYWDLFILRSEGDFPFDLMVLLLCSYFVEDRVTNQECTKQIRHALVK